MSRVGSRSASGWASERTASAGCWASVSHPDVAPGTGCTHRRHAHRARRRIPKASRGPRPPVLGCRPRRTPEACTAWAQARASVGPAGGAREARQRGSGADAVSGAVLELPTRRVVAAVGRGPAWGGRRAGDRLPGFRCCDGPRAPRPAARVRLPRGGRRPALRLPRGVTGDWPRRRAWGEHRLARVARSWWPAAGWDFRRRT